MHRQGVGLRHSSDEEGNDCGGEAETQQRPIKKHLSYWRWKTGGNKI